MLLPSSPTLKGPGKLRNRLLAVGVLVYLLLMYVVLRSMGDPHRAPTADDTIATEQDTLPLSPEHGRTTTADRLDGDDHEDAMPTTAPETPAATADDETTSCDSQVNRNADPNHTRAHLDFWHALDSGTITQHRDAWKHFMATDAVTNTPHTFQRGRGVVLVAGNRDTFDRALTAVKLLRLHLSCSLPVEVWHMPDEHPSNDTARQLEAYGATPRDLSDAALPRPVHGRRDAEKQFQIKAAAIINSRFEELLYLDSDNFPTVNPAFLFDTDDYKQTGALFWPDFWKTHTDNKIFDVLDVPCRDEWEQESGQIVVDKRRAWRPLQLAWYMQQNHELYFQFLNGDKDTFKFAWKALHAPYHMVDVFLGMGGTIVAGRFCGHTMLQYTDDIYSDEKPVFVHANLLKITDKIHFMQGSTSGAQQVERPWQQIKRYANSRGSTWMSPTFYIAPGGRACMDFTNFQGEPDTTVTSFDHVLDGFQDKYFELGGIGGETRG